MPNEKQVPPVSPDDEDPDDDALEESSPSSDGSSAQAAGDNADRNREAQQGRELAAARREAEDARRIAVEQARQIQELSATVNRITGHLGQQAEQQRQAKLATLPPEQRAVAEIQMLRQEVAALRAQPPRASPSGPDAETLRMARSIITQYEDDFDLDDGTIDLKDPRLVWDTEEDFRDSVRKAAKQDRRARLNGDETVAKKSSNGTEQPKVDKGAVKQARAEILAELGLSRPNSAQPASGGRGSASDEITTLHQGYKAKGGMKGQLERLKEIRDNARVG